MKFSSQYHFFFLAKVFIQLQIALCVSYLYKLFAKILIQVTTSYWSHGKKVMGKNHILNMKTSRQCQWWNK